MLGKICRLYIACCSIYHHIGYCSAPVTVCYSTVLFTPKLVALGVLVYTNHPAVRVQCVLIVTAAALIAFEAALIKESKESNIAIYHYVPILGTTFTIALSSIIVGQLVE